MTSESKAVLAEGRTHMGSLLTVGLDPSTATPAACEKALALLIEKAGHIYDADEARFRLTQTSTAKGPKKIVINFLNDEGHFWRGLLTAHIKENALLPFCHQLSTDTRAFAEALNATAVTVGQPELLRSFSEITPDGRDRC